ncbi:peptide ABC transporter permease [Burkholderia pyrrocinia]|uniref:Peptide ABC transporter permease n=1 Tax=Burkholderia pyrrocinia TaxID=60550 RepID=A0A2Z5N9R0_BURPY|nr:peptide ABC transporter permease [Burkholderia pyrrocinia]
MASVKNSTDTAGKARSMQRVPASVGLAILWIAAMIILAVLADKLMPFDFSAIDLRNRLAPPIGFGGTATHWLGTDELGRDMLSRLLLSIRMSIMIAFGATIIGAAIGTIMGFVAAHFRGPVESLVLILVDFQASMPFLILALAVLAFVGNSLTIFVMLLSLYGWERYARIARGLALRAQGEGYAAAVRQLGAHPLRIYVRHILPNIASTLIVSMTLAFPEIMLVESGLSFLGLGVQPPMTSLGAMIGYGRDYLTRAPWILLSPSLVISLTALAISIVGDWLRDRLDTTE